MSKEVEKITVKSPEVRLMESQNRELEKELAVKNDKVDLLFEEFEKFKRSVTWDDVKKEY